MNSSRSASSPPTVLRVRGSFSLPPAAAVAVALLQPALVAAWFRPSQLAAPRRSSPAPTAAAR